MNFNNCFIATLLAYLTILPVSGVYAEEEFPNSILGLVRPGMRVIVKSNDKDSSVTLTITDEETCKVIDDARNLGLGVSELKEKYPSFAKRVKDVLAEYKPRISKEGNLPSGESVTEPDIVLQSGGSWLLPCTVKHVGDDYVLVSFERYNQTLTQAFPKALISRINTGYLYYFSITQ